MGLVIPAKAGTHRPRTWAALRPVGPRHDLPADGVSGAGHLLGPAAWGERGCGDDVRGRDLTPADDRAGINTLLSVRPRLGSH